MSTINIKNLTAASPLHDELDRDCLEMKLSQEESEKYKARVWELINLNRMLFGAACSIAMQEIVLSFPKLN